MTAKIGNEGIFTDTEIKQKLIDVHTKSIQEDITPDYTLAKLNEKERTAIQEMGTNADYIRKLYKRLSIEARKHEWNKKKQEWTSRPLNETEKEKVDQHAQSAYAAIMTRLNLLVITNRNRQGNWLPQELLSKTREGQEEEQEEQDKKGIWQGLKSMFSKPKTTQYEET